MQMGEVCGLLLLGVGCYEMCCPPCCRSSHLGLVAGYSCSIPTINNYQSLKKKKKSIAEPTPASLEMKHVLTLRTTSSWKSPGEPVVRTPSVRTLSLLRTCVRSLIGELGSRMPPSTAKKKPFLKLSRISVLALNLDPFISLYMEH